MKPATQRITMPVLLLTIFTTDVHAEPSVGATLDYGERLLFYENAEGDIFDHWDTLGGSLVFDTKYFRLATGIDSHFGAFLHHVDGKERSDSRYRIEYLTLTALGKVPFDVSRRIRLWPALGLRGAYCLRYRHTGDPKGAVDDAPNDLLLLLGGGGEYSLSRRFAFTSAVLADVNMTPSAGDGASGPIAFGFGLNLGVLCSL